MTTGKLLTSYVALLRGINVSGKNSIQMDGLKESFSTLGFSKLQTYLQSGNVVFQTIKSDEGNLAAKIQAQIKHDFGYEVPVLVMSCKDLNGVANTNPLWPKSGGDEKFFHSTFLFKPVPGGNFASLKLPVVAGEQAVMSGSVVLLHCPHGYGKTKLNNSYFERVLGVPATTRNWRTVLALQALCGG